MQVLFHHSTYSLPAAGRTALLIPVLLLLATSPLLAQGQSEVSHDTLVLVDFPTHTCAALWPALKLELEHSKISKLLGGKVVWMTRDEFHDGMEFSLIYQIKLLGDCRIDATSDTQDAPGTPLGWVFMVHEDIQPFVYVDCDRLAQMLHRELRNKTTAERKRLLSRAISRVVYHEMTHIVTQNPLHARSGVLKAHVAPHDLLAYYAE
jgi:hypothetical protein